MRFVLCLALLALSPLQMIAAEVRPMTLYLQFVIGTTENKPPITGATPIGPKLRAVLSPVFKWEHYWEVRRHTVILAKDQLIRIRMAPERFMELELVDPNNIELRAFRNGEPRKKTVVKAKQKMSVLGGDASGDDGWFLVVRHDKPSTE